MWSYITCEDSPPHIIFNKPFKLKFKVAHLCFFKKKKLFFKLYIDDVLVEERIDDRFIFLMSVINYLFEDIIEQASSNDTVNIKVEVGYRL
jgi:hypothetical protein